MSVHSSITADSILQAHRQISSGIHRTPVVTCTTLNQLSGSDLYFKCENFQKIGAFKIRGGLHAVLSLSPEERKKGVATHSSGNHAQAIAYAARAVGSKAYIVMPENSPKVKVDAVRSYEAEIHFCAPNQEARESTLQKIVAKTGASFIHPYNDLRVITGQATCAVEFMEQVPNLDVILSPVGGGGLLSGTLLSVAYFSPSIKVYGTEPEGAADAVLSLRSGKIEKAPFINTIADGLLTTLGDLTFPIIQSRVSDILTVSDAEIIASLKLCYERMKIVAEPSGVVPLAALLKHRELFAGKKVGLIISGGNVDVSKLSGWW
jgi:threonine dehydratase